MFPFFQRQSEAFQSDPEYQGWMIDFANRLKTEPEDVSLAVSLMSKAIAVSAADRWGRQHFLRSAGIAEHIPVDPSDPTIDVAFRHDWSEAQLDIPAAFRAGYRDRFERVPGVSVSLEPVAAFPASPNNLPDTQNIVPLADYRQERQERLSAATIRVEGSAQSASIIGEQLRQASGF